MTEQTTTAAYRLVVPDGWFVIDLEPGRRERSIAALVERQFAGIDNVPHLKAQARQETLAKAESAYSAGGVEMFLSLQQIAGIPVAASLVIFLVPPPATGAVTAEELAATLAGDEGQVSVVDLPAGTSVRLLRRAGSDGLDGFDGSAGRDGSAAFDRDAASATLEVFAPVPDSGWWLLLSFAAPIGPLAPALTKLFDAISMTLRWDR
jgi:hypothetical protein